MESGIPQPGRLYNQHKYRNRFLSAGKRHIMYNGTRTQFGKDNRKPVMRCSSSGH